MKILNIKAKNFRNLKNIDVKFWNINILTGKNSTWKTNLTQLLTYSLATNPDVKSYFWENITTYQPWISQTTIETTIEDNSAFFNSNEWFLWILKPIFKYKHIISKNPLFSLTQEIKYQWTEHQYEKITDFINDDTSGIELKRAFIKEISVYNKTYWFIDWFDGIIWEELINNNDWKYLKIFEDITRNSIINDDDQKSFSSSALNIFNKIIEKNKELWLIAVENIKSWELKRWYSDFSSAKFISLLADLQSNEKQFIKFNNELSYFTDWVLKNVHINIEWSLWSKGDIYIDSPSGPRDIDFISAWTSLILYFVLLKNWLDLPSKSFKDPGVMIFDELDSSIHPSLIEKFSELLIIISNKIQLFISTHSTIFIDCFDKKDIFLLKDVWSFSNKVNVKSNILSYQDIIDTLKGKEKEIFKNMRNSELYINGYLDSLFPVIFK